ncbi:hypothetical protein WG908_09895 [Sphingobium sp. AN641]|uniref:hypothetical protein n=1 Tax=Sphingobium sp. AN641 TaxID=3133443 RepID=UPI0030C22ADD
MKKSVAISGVIMLAGAPTAASASAYLATIGSPNSIQHVQVSTALNLNDLEFDDDPETADFEMEGDADVVGGAVSYWGSAGVEGQRYELRYQKQFRPFEGSRARVLIDTPLNILHVNDGKTAVIGTLSTGVEIPVQPNWLITPRIAYGITDAGRYFGSTSNELLTVSATSRYKIGQVGRGDLTIGNMVAYSTTTKIGLGRKPAFGYLREEVITFRNGLAYQLPLKGRMFGGRQGSIRASYVWTKLIDDPQSYEDVHEVGVSIGVRTREAEQKNRFEQLRVGLLYTRGISTFSHDFDYDAVSLTLGYRF